ncbi:MAG: acyl-CoA dehydrogenase family protein, partial [Desulfobacterales bacterium]|nr:acyl-CoA dehydrogenase family protein [Desulfobacterales bacterium]
MIEWESANSERIHSNTLTFNSASFRTHFPKDFNVNLDFSAEDQRFREQVKDWLADHVPRTRPPATAQGQREYLLEWQRIQHEGGWAGISWPKAYGGAGLPLQRQVIWHEEYARAGAPRID